MNLSPQVYVKLIFVVFLATISLSGCAKQTTVVLLPDPSGKVGKVTVASDGGSVDITKAQEATVIKGRQSAPSQPTIISKKAIQKDFSEALNSLPEQPVHFILYFERDSNKLTAESKKVIPEVLATVTERDSQNISVIGHSDTAGNRDYNLRLSNLRALAIATILKDQGIKNSYIKTTSHGENNPLIPTKDNVHEPKNRRVEIVVR
jgi:outer membrane protein OmpA-like peptidoglycan-associated protein